jgi:hypothetical protein
VRQYDIIYHEAPQVGNLVTNHHLAKSISDAAWSAFLGILSVKAAGAGKRVNAVDTAYTRQTVPAVDARSGKAYRCAGIGVPMRAVGSAYTAITTRPGTSWRWGRRNEKVGSGRPLRR